MQAYNSYLTDSGLNRAMATGMRTRPRFQSEQAPGLMTGSNGAIMGQGRFTPAQPYPPSLVHTSGEPIGGVDIPPSGGGNPPTTAPFPVGGTTPRAPGGPIVTTPVSPPPAPWDAQPMPYYHPYNPPFGADPGYMPIGTDPNTGEIISGSNPGHIYDPYGGHYGPGGTPSNPNAADRFGGSTPINYGGFGPGGYAGAVGNAGRLTYAGVAASGLAGGPLSESPTSVAGAGGWKYLTHKPALQT